MREIYNEESGLRYYLEGKPLHAGDQIAICNEAAWHLVRYEWNYDEKSLPVACFDEMQQAIFMGEIKTVVVWRLDRLSRSQVDGINTLAAWCEQGIRPTEIAKMLGVSRGTVNRYFEAKEV